VKVTPMGESDWISSSITIADYQREILFQVAVTLENLEKGSA